jgi:hypothetical protein
MLHIHSRTELIEWAAEAGVRHDWHEPDEQDVTATVVGTCLDNAGFWAVDVDPYGGTNDEMCVVLEQPGKETAAINLATLLAFATGTYEGN